MDGLYKDIGSLKEGMEWVKSNLSELRKEVKEINQDRWTAKGIAAVIGTISSVIVTIAIKLFLK